MVDAEFGRVGPCAYDMGLLLATLLLLYHRHRHARHVLPPHNGVKAELPEQQCPLESSPRSQASAEGGVGHQTPSRLADGPVGRGGRTRGGRTRGGRTRGGRTPGGRTRGAGEAPLDTGGSEAACGHQGNAQRVLAMCSAMSE